MGEILGNLTALGKAGEAWLLINDVISFKAWEFQEDATLSLTPRVTATRTQASS